MLGPMTITIHAIFHAHLDPIWMWPWTAGLDEVIATSRSACDRLDRHPELFYTQGEAWSFAMVERADPPLFARIRAHVASGRWEVVNGWWTQPDCNHPSVDGLRQQIRQGLDWVQERFGVTPNCGFNPDSFGHCAILPELLREAGQTRYVMMRPGDGELRLPSRLFTWRTRNGGAGITAFRIAATYNNGAQAKIDQRPVQQALEQLPPGCQHTMAFFGVGNHGGGPTERLVAWVQANRESFPGARLEFSTIERFFNAIEHEAPALPEVVGELQQHAVGCYSVLRAVKTEVHRAEHALTRASAVATLAEQPALRTAWQAVTSHHFHDTLGGTAIPEAYRAVCDQLGGACGLADEVLAYAVRRQLAALPDDVLPRVVLANPGTTPLSGWHEATIYLEGSWLGTWRLLDVQGAEVPFQILPSQIGVVDGWAWNVRRILVHATIPANGVVALRLDPTTAPAAVPAQVAIGDSELRNHSGTSIDLSGRRPQLRHGALTLPFALHLLPDPTDTWSHGIDRYADSPAEEPQWNAPQVIDRGPLMAAMSQQGTIGRSTLSAEWRLHADASWVDVELTVEWREAAQLLKLVLPGSGTAERCDGTPGMALIRPNDGRELPLHGFTSLGGHAVVCPTVYALDATPERARLTLLRAPLMADHINTGFPRAQRADQGIHRFQLRLHLAPTTPEQLSAEVLAWQRPALVAELTRGMPARYTEYRAGGILFG